MFKKQNEQVKNLNSSNKKGFLITKRRLFILPPLVLILLVIAVSAGLLSSNSSYKAKLSATIGSTTTTPTIKAPFPTIPGCPVKITPGNLIAGQRGYDFACQQIAKIRAHEIPTPTIPPATPTVKLGAEVTGSGGNECSQAFAVVYHSGNSDSIATSEYQDIDLDGHFVCLFFGIHYAVESPLSSTNRPNQGYVAIMSAPLTKKTNSQYPMGIPTINPSMVGPILSFDPVADGTITMTGINGDILSVSDAAGNKYTLNVLDPTPTLIPVNS
jgi:hypothetical protein